MARDAQIFKDHLSLIVLSTLAGRTMYGYELVQTVKARTGDALTLREGVLYPILHRMVADGLLSSEWGDTVKGPRRRYYRITAKGEATRTRQADEWRQFAGMIDTLIGASSCIA